ncbi:MAG: NUDIX domain-containing protein [Kofleriaceae bacterium]|nr:NUDIX domain-containing protein [Kofleriaceae bacterium]MCB9574443.1 NUDIX domain-containing protein [Kofleriaceae bacterium]
MAPARDLFCHACGAAFADTQVYPRTCANPGCGAVVWANPIPVAVALVPIVDGDRTGLLVVRRAIGPRVGMLALVGGFVEAHERWQAGAAREVVEETGVVVDEASVTLMDAVSTAPRPDRILMFATTAALAAATLPPFVASAECSGRGIVFGPDGLDEVFAFPLHAAAARRWFAGRGITGPHDHVER